MRSDLSGFYDLSVEERLEKIKDICNLTDEEAEIIRKTGCLSLKTSDMMIENVIGTIELPVGIATNFRVNGHDVLVPMSLEEPSVVAAASNAAKMARPDGFTAESDEPIMIGQIQIMEALPQSKEKILALRDEIAEMVNAKDSTLVKLGGGLKDIEVRELDSQRGKILVVHLLVNVQDAMGANAVNTMCEAVAPFLEELTGGRSVLKIISNLAIHRITRARAVWSKDILGEEVIEGILDAYAFAQADKYRCATHNKGIMNGVDAVMIATGNDFRAAEAGAHSYAALHSYHPLTHYEKDVDGNLVGTIELPMVAGIVGGATRTNPIATVALKIMNVKKASDLAEISACVGMANNFAALRAMVTEGIQAGHMKLHAANIATIAGATHDEVQRVARRMIREKKISVAYATEVLEDLRNGSKEVL
jgi:hydroxymethylglutaryl-CoA reductase